MLGSLLQDLRYRSIRSDHGKGQMTGVLLAVAESTCKELVQSAPLRVFEQVVGGLCEQRVAEAQQLPIVLEYTGSDGFVDRALAPGERLLQQSCRRSAQCRDGRQRAARGRGQGLDAGAGQRFGGGPRPTRADEATTDVAAEAPGDLEGVEGITSGFALQAGQIGPSQGQAKVLPDQLVDGVQAKGADGELAHRSIEGQGHCGQYRSGLGRAHGGQQCQAHRARTPNSVGKDAGRLRIKPGQVVDRDDQW